MLADGSAGQQATIKSMKLLGGWRGDAPTAPGLRNFGGIWRECPTIPPPVVARKLGP